MKFLSVILGLFVVLLFADSASAGRFCVVQVKDSAAHRYIGRDPRRIDALPSVILLNLGTERWTIDADRRLVPYSGSYPISYLDKGKLIIEPWSSRTVAASWGNGAVSIIPSGSKEFVRVDDGKRAAYDGPFVLPRQRVTIVTYNAKPFLVGEKALIPWNTQDELAKLGMDGAVSLFDLPSLQGTIVVDREKTIFALSDNGDSRRLGRLAKDDYVRVFDSPYAKASLLIGPKSVWLIEKASDGFSSKTLATSYSNGADRRYYYSHLFGQVLAHEYGGFAELRARWRISDLRLGWRRLGPGEFQLISGGDDPLAAPTSQYGGDNLPGWNAKDLKAIGAVLINGAGGYFLYDGAKISPIADGERAKIGLYPRPYDLPSIGRVFIGTAAGLKELRNHRLLDVPANFPTDVWGVDDWAESASAVLFSKAGVFVVDKGLFISPVDGSAGIAFEGHIGATNPSTGEMVLPAKDGSTYLLVDTERSGKEACSAIR